MPAPREVERVRDIAIELDVSDWWSQPPSPRPTLLKALRGRGTKVRKGGTHPASGRKEGAKRPGKGERDWKTGWRLRGWRGGEEASALGRGHSSLCLTRRLEVGASGSVLRSEPRPRLCWERGTHGFAPVLPSLA